MDDAWEIREFLRSLDVRMGSEDLLDKRRSGARQPDYENRIRLRRADTGTHREELRGTHLDLLACIGLGNLRIVEPLGALECIATVVKLPRFRVLVPVLVSLAKREAQMVAINILSARCSFRGAHTRDLVLRKTIALEIGKAPVSIAEAGSDGCRRMIGLDRFHLPSDCFE